MKFEFGQRCLMAILVWGVLWLVDVGEAGGDVFGEVAVTAKPVENFSMTSHGYVEYQFLVENLSGQNRHEVTLIFPEMSYGYGQHIRQIRRSAVVGPQSTVGMTLWQPPITIDGSGLRVIIDGRDYRMSMNPCNHTVEYSSFGPYGRYYGMGGGANRSCILASRGIRSDCQALADKAMPIEESGSSRSSRSYYAGSSGRSQDYEIKRSETEVAQWSDSWLGYSRYDGVMVSAEDMRTMPGGGASGVRALCRERGESVGGGRLAGFSGMAGAEENQSGLRYVLRGIW